MRALTLEQKIGQMLLVGYPGGDEGEAAIRRVIESRPVGNLILFARNGDRPEALRRRLSGLRSLIASRSGVAPLVAIDQEGGVVVRLKDGMTPLPGAMAMAAAVAGGAASLSDVEAMAAVAGAELSSLGIDWNLAPDADVNVNRDNPVIGVRSFGEDPAAVAELASAYARGLKRSGVAATAKHFPGHGDTNVDSHLGLPRVDATMERLESVELVPFKRLIDEGVGSIMTAHVLFPAVEPEAIPATISRRALTGLLRERLGYRGVIVTDCLEMKAVDGRYEDVPVRAVLAGADVLCVSHTAEKQEAAFDALLAAVKSGRVPESRIDESVERILALKARVAEAQASASGAAAGEAAGGKALALAGPEGVALAERIAAASISFVTPGTIPDLSAGGLYVDMQPETLTGAEDRRVETVTVSGELSRLGSEARCVALPCDPSEADIEALCSGLGTGPVVVGVYSMSRYPAQATLVRRVAAACAERGLPLAFASMRDPYDAAPVAAAGGAGRAVICAYEYTSLSARAVARVLTGRASVPGSCPVAAIGPA